jgi:maltose O-acetyltransferase
MNPLKLFKIRTKHFALLLRIVFQLARVNFYQFISDATVSKKNCKQNQPVLTTGKGKIILGKCNFGIWPSPYFFSGYTHIEARSPESKIVIGDGVYINNNAVIIADRTFIRIGNNTLIGPEFSVYDSDFHSLNPEQRNTDSYECRPVDIGENVFIGSRVTVLKGVTIGNNSIVAAGSVVIGNVSYNTIVGGVPARVIGAL